TKNASTIGTSAMHPAMRNAVCPPGAPASATVCPSATPEWSCAEYRATSMAVPAAPPTCCMVLSAADPCEYSGRAREPSDADIRGVIEEARPTESTAWTPARKYGDVPASTCEYTKSDDAMRIVPGMRR